MDFVIRRARCEDIPEICAAYEEFDEIHWTALPGIFARRSDHSSPDKKYFDDVIADPDSALFVAEFNGHVAGVLFAYLTARSEPQIAPMDFVGIDSIIVRAGHRGMGIGRALLDAVHAWARERNAAQVELTVFEFNEAAIHLYERYGYRTESRHMVCPVDSPL